MAGNESKAEKELKLLKALTLSITKAKDFTTALDIFLQEICTTTGWSYGEVWLPSNDNKTLYISNVYYGEHEELKEFYAQSKEIVITPTTGLPGLVWQSKRPYWMKAIISDNRFIRMKSATQFNLKSALGIPVLADGKMISVIVFFMLEVEEHEWLVDMMLTVVGQLGLLFKRLSLEDNVRKVNRALRVLSDCNQTIIRATDELSLLNEICKIAVDPGGYRMALIAFAQHDAHKSIKIVTYAGFAGDYIEELNDLTWADSQPKKAVSGKAIRTGKPFIVRDIGSEPDFSPWRDAAFKQGYQSVMFLPLIIDNNVIGVFNIYTSELDAFDAEEQKLLEELANDVAYGIMSLRTKIEKQKIQEQLFQAQKMEAMGQLAAGIGHDFNNMLTAVVGYGSILYNKLKDNEQLRYNAEQILNASEKAAVLVQSLLTFGRKHDTALTLLDLNKVITNILGLLNKLLGEHVVLKTELTSEQLMVMGNRTQLSQVLMNLVGNSNDAMPGGGSLTINSMVAGIDETFIKEHGFGRQGRFACVTVTDTGSGMDTNTLQKIFDPFFTTKPDGKGTGLGLSVVYSIVNQHRGFIDVHSELGKGTTFYIYLPLTGDMPDNK